MVLVHSHAERIVVLFNDEIVADHPRHFRRDQTIYDPWHYLPVLLKKPGALRNGAPFKDWDLPPNLAQVRAKLAQHADGDRQFVKVLGTVPDHGLAAVPMLIEGHALGGMVFRFAEPKRYDEAEIQFMLSMARQSALALERARLYEAERRARSASEVARFRVSTCAISASLNAKSPRRDRHA